jgi:hypothetical protein
LALIGAGGNYGEGQRSLGVAIGIGISRHRGPVSLEEEIR